MIVGIMNNLPELIGGGVFAAVMFWLGRKSVGFNLFEWMKSRFVRR
jgi:hypothetical protein